MTHTRQYNEQIIPAVEEKKKRKDKSLTNSLFTKHCIPVWGFGQHSLVFTLKHASQTGSLR